MVLCPCALQYSRSGAMLTHSCSLGYNGAVLQALAVHLSLQGALELPAHQRDGGSGGRGGLAQRRQGVSVTALLQYEADVDACIRDKRPP